MANKKKGKILDSPLKEMNDKTLAEIGIDKNKTQQQEDENIPINSFLSKNGYESSVKGEDEGRKVNIIGEDEIKKASGILQKYKEQKRVLDQRIVNNEEWWKLRNWEQIEKNRLTNENDIKPNSAWLFNSIMNKIADFSDNYPEPHIRARTVGDYKEAQRLKNVIPMILSRNDYEETYISTIESKVKSGTGITGVFWNKSKDGLGDVDIREIDMLSIYWQPGITDIQMSRNVFTTELIDTDLIKEMYPEYKEDITSNDDMSLAKYIYEDYIDTSDKSCVVDWYYKKKGVLHYVKFVGNIVLIATENEPDAFPNGLYDDGNYPFVVDTLFKMKGTVAGFGYIDVGKNPQEYIDLLDSAILKNTMMRAKPRYFKRTGASINNEEFLDWNTAFVETDGNLGQDDLREISVSAIDNSIFNQRDSKVNELKETTGNRDVSTGGTTSGVTAASAISALIETGSKGSRLAIKGSYNAYKKVIYLIIERIRQFYNMPRFVRIIGDDGTESFETYTNENLIMQEQIDMQGEESRYLPEFDIEVSAQKASPYNKMSQNDLALQFYQFGFFNPQNTDQTLACLDMMDFDHKSDIVKQVRKNGTILDALNQAQAQLQQMQAENEKLKVLCDLYVPDSNLTGNNYQSVSQQGQADNQSMQSGRPTGIQQGIKSAESNSLAQQRKEQAAAATQPR